MDDARETYYRKRAWNDEIWRLLIAAMSPAANISIRVDFGYTALVRREQCACELSLLFMR